MAIAAKIAVPVIIGTVWGLIYTICEKNNPEPPSAVGATIKGVLGVVGAFLFLGQDLLGAFVVGLISGLISFFVGRWFW